MSRNIRRKAAPPPRRKKKARRDSTSSSSSLDLSSDGGYSALEDLSDSEDDDEDGVDATEEKYIIHDVAKNRPARLSPRLKTQNGQQSHHGHATHTTDPGQKSPKSPKSSKSSKSQRSPKGSSSQNGLNSQLEHEDADKEDEDGDGESDDDLFPLSSVEPGEDGDEEDDEEDDDDDDDDEDDDDDDDDDDEDDYDGEGDAEDDGNSWNGIATESDANYGGVPLTPKQVRFAGVPDSDSDSTTTELSDLAAEFFPDIFVEQNSLDPSFRREIEDESDSTVSSSFWDYSSAYGHGGDLHIFADDPPATPSASGALLPSTPLPPVAEERSGLVEEVGDDEDSHDGYETDGDTTEEEEPDEMPIQRKMFCRALSVDSDSSESDSDSDASVVVRHRRGHPRVGRFVLSAHSSKPVAVMHPATGKMVIFTPEKPRRQPDSLSDAHPPGAGLLPPPQLSHAAMVQSSPLISNSASVMMGAMFSSHTFGDYVNSQSVGPIEAFFPSLSSDAFLGEESDDFSGELVEDDGELNLRIEDFIQFERNISEAGDKNEGSAAALADATTPTQTTGDKSGFPSEAEDNAGDGGVFLGFPDTDGENGGTPMAITPAGARRTSFGMSAALTAGEDEAAAAGAAMATDGDNGNDYEEADDGIALPPLLAHFDKNADAVGAFRRNQIDQQLIYSNKATAESLAFSGPYIMGTLRGIKNGSLEAVTTPITPPRRRKRHSMSFAGHHGRREDYVRSPLSSVVQKRKASGEGAASDHKRQRSISEVKDLYL